MTASALRSILAIAGVATIGALAAPAAAQISISNPVFTIIASNGSSTATYSVLDSDPNFFFVDDPVEGVTYFWTTLAPVALTDNASNTVATLVSMTIVAGRNDLAPGGPRWGIDVDFGVVAGASDTTFELISPTLSFATLGNASATFTGTLGGTDQDSNGFSLTSALGSGAGLEGTYNGGTLFRNYFNGSISALPAGSAAFPAGNMTPPGAFDPVGGNVSDISSRFRFTLSANDAAAGTSAISVVPTPATMSLLAVGGLLAARRRR